MYWHRATVGAPRAGALQLSFVDGSKYVSNTYFGAYSADATCSELFGAPRFVALSAGLSR